MIKFIDDFLNGITMYRLVLYYLILLLVVAAILSFFGILPFSLISLLFSVSILVIVCRVTNTVFAKVFKVPTNFESVYISALILALIITPIRTFHDIPFFFWVGILAMASKYILAINKKHIFNPAAFAIALSAITINSSASWWIGTLPMMLPVLVGGLLVVRKIKRFSMVLSFFFFSLVSIFGFSILRGNDALLVTQKIITDTPILFFALVMLTEPQTTPPTKKLQILYGTLVGLLFAILTPEIALLLGNIFSYIVSPKEKLLLKLTQKLQVAPGIYDFVFGLENKLFYLPGQYMEWTLGYKNPDSRGNRRYFTIAASPTEGNLRIGVKFYPNSSSFKKTLVSLSPGNKIVASQLAGEFTLPKDPNKKLAFIAGGIGITPFRSIIKFLLDTKQKRDIVLFYSNKLAQDIVYKDIFDKALQQLGIKTVYVLTDTANIPPGWDGKVGFVDEKMIKEEIPDYKDRIFYISGPHSMVDSFEKTLKEMGVSGNNLKIDFFPGYA